MKALDWILKLLNYSIDRPIHFYLKYYDFGHNAWIAFCYVIRISVTYKIGQNDFDAISFQGSPETLSHFRCNLLFFNKDVIKIIYLNYETCIKIVCWNICYSNDSKLNHLKKFQHSLAH